MRLGLPEDDQKVREPLGYTEIKATSCILGPRWTWTNALLFTSIYYPVHYCISSHQNYIPYKTLSWDPWPKMTCQGGYNVPSEINIQPQCRLVVREGEPIANTIRGTAHSSGMRYLLPKCQITFWMPHQNKWMRNHHKSKKECLPSLNILIQDESLGNSCPTKIQGHIMQFSLHKLPFINQILLRGQKTSERWGWIPKFVLHNAELMHKQSWPYILQKKRITPMGRRTGFCLTEN